MIKTVLATIEDSKLLLQSPHVLQQGDRCVELVANFDNSFDGNYCIFQLSMGDKHVMSAAQPILSGMAKVQFFEIMDGSGVLEVQLKIVDSHDQQIFLSSKAFIEVEKSIEVAIGKTKEQQQTLLDQLTIATVHSVQKAEEVGQYFGQTKQQLDQLVQVATDLVQNEQVNLQVTNVVHELGQSEVHVLSQKAVTELMESVPNYAAMIMGGSMTEVDLPSFGKIEAIVLRGTLVVMDAEGNVLVNEALTTGKVSIFSRNEYLAVYIDKANFDAGTMSTKCISTDYHQLPYRVQLSGTYGTLRVWDDV